MTVTPEGVEDLSPASAIVSFIAPDKPFDYDVIESFCHYVHNFASRESAERWASQRDGIVLLPVSEAFQVGLRAWSKWRDGTTHGLAGEVTGRITPSVRSSSAI